MSSNIGKKNIAHKGSGHGVVAPAAMSLLTPPAPPAPTPFPYTARAANASDTASKLIVGGNQVLVEGSTMSLDPPANQPAQSGGGDVVTHATKNIAVMTMGSFCYTVGGKGVCATGDIAALNVITKQSKVAQMALPLLEAGDFDTASKSNASAAAMNRLYRRAYPPTKSKQCRGGHPVDLGTGYVVDDAVDLVLPGHFPLVFSRSYSSANSLSSGALGRGGFTHSFEQWIEIKETGLRYHDEDGIPVDFAPVADGGVSFHRGARLELRHHAGTYEIRSLDDRRTRSFSPLPGGRIALRSIHDSREHRILLEYTGDRLTRVIDTVKRELRITNDEKGRVKRVEVWAREPGSDAPLSLMTFFEYGYHPEGELASVTNALGHADRFFYDGLHRMVRVQLRNSLSFYYEYDEDSGHCIHTWGDGGLHDLHIDIDFEKGVTTTHGSERARRYFWKNGIVFREETFGGEWAVERAYDADELLIARKNGAGEGTTYERDARGNLVKEIDAAGNITEFENHDDLPVRRIDASGVATSYARDAHGSLVGITRPGAASTVFLRDREGRIAAIHERDGARLQFEYDEHNNVAKETQARGAVTSFRHDALGRPIEQIDALLRKTTVRYNILDQIEEVVRPDGSRISATYDKLGHPASVRDTLGGLTELEHSGTGRLARIVQPDLQVFRFVYDAEERLVEIINPRMERYCIEYDAADQIVAEKSFDGRWVEYRYDRAGRVARIQYPEDEWRELQYDKLGFIVEDRGEDVQISFARDALGRVQKAECKDVLGSVVTEFERDNAGRILADIQDGRAVRYHYDDAGRVVARILPGGERTEYRYDEQDALSQLIHEGRVLEIKRDNLGRERERRAKGFSLAFDYDGVDRVLLQRVMAEDPRASVTRNVPKKLVERVYSYDIGGRLSAIEGLGGRVSTYRHDRIHQLIGAERAGFLEVFSYDPAGSITGILNELDRTQKKESLSLGSGNRLGASDSARYEDDGRGRRLFRVGRRDGQDLGESTTLYGWDSKDRLREVVLPNGTRVRFQYDAFGRRVRKYVLGKDAGLASRINNEAPSAERAESKTISFLWDGEVICEEIDSSKEPRAQKRIHVHAPGTFVPMLQAELGQVFGVIPDHLGLPKELIDENGNIAWRAEHGAWGNLIEPKEKKGSVESPFRLLGQYFDEETGLCSTRFRYFEASTGRWLCPDPLGVWGGMNLFGFNTSPVLGADPFGLGVMPPCGATVVDANALALANDPNRLYLGHYGGEGIILPGGMRFPAVLPGISWMQGMQRRFGGKILNDLPGEFSHMKPNIDSATQIIFNIGDKGINPGSLTHQEFTYVTSNPHLMAKTIFVTGATF